MVACGCIAFGLQFIAGCQKDSPEPTSDEDAQARQAAVRAKIDDLPSAAAAPDDWPWWRGPGGNNVCQAGQPPPHEMERYREHLVAGGITRRGTCDTMYSR